MTEVQNMAGKTCLITGSTGGIGRVTAEGLARAGATVVMVGRNPQKTAEVAAQIRQNTGNERIETIIGDLSVQQSVRTIAETFLQRHNRLHVLVNNAGEIFMEHRLSADGIEMTFALNHIAYFLLTNLLLDTLKASAPARIINVSSGAHLGGRMSFEDLRDPRKYSGWKAYSQSKLANVLFTYELARHLEGTGVTVNALHPGFVATNFGASNGGLFKPFFRLVQLAAITPEQGAQTSLYLATSSEVEGVTGKYFTKCKPVRSSPTSYDKDTARRLWEVSLAMTGLPESV